MASGDRTIADDTTVADPIAHDTCSHPPAGDTRAVPDAVLAAGGPFVMSAEAAPVCPAPVGATKLLLTMAITGFVTGAPPERLLTAGSLDRAARGTPTEQPYWPEATDELCDSDGTLFDQRGHAPPGLPDVPRGPTASFLKSLYVRFSR